MAGRESSSSKVRRAPLGEATDRVINTSSRSQHPMKHQHRSIDAELNPLRAHPTDTSVQEPTELRYGSLVAESSSANIKSSSRNRISIISQEDRDGDKRNSQISTSSGASSGNRKTHIGPWQLGKTLGKGSAGRVRLARHHTTQQLVAVKILAKSMTTINQSGSLAEIDRWDRNKEEYTSQRHIPLSVEREVAILKLIDHPNIVKFYDIWENRSEIYLVLEYMDFGDLLSYVNRKGPIPEYEMMYYFRQILSALQYVHSFNICHRDLKPENILMSDDGTVKIADFGMAAIQQSPTHYLRTSCGSPHYAAPELINRSRYSGDKVDVWSLGVMLFACMAGYLPFDDPDGDVDRLLAKAVKGVYEMSDSLSDDAQHLVTLMLKVDPTKRISTKKIWKHPLLRKYDDLDDLNDGGHSLDTRKLPQCKPVDPQDLDMQTLRQLKSLWHTFSEKHLALRLVSPEPNDQKLFYWLLLNYREKQLENYDPGLAHSNSDFHHLQPPNWKKKYTTLEFPAPFGRAPSRFTVISNIATDSSIEGAENATDAGGTVHSYDPYKSSRVMAEAVASKARIVVHRNGSSAKNSARTSTLQKMRNGSVHSSSTSYSRHGSAKRRRLTLASPALRSSRPSSGSLVSGESGSYTRPASRQKRGVDFSHLGRRSAAPQDETEDWSSMPAPASIAGDDTTYNRDHMSPSSSVRMARPPRNVGGRGRHGAQTMANMSKAKNEKALFINEELRKFSHSIARDCDDAFNSTLLSPQSHLSQNHREPSVVDDARSISIMTATPTPAAHSAREGKGGLRGWDSRPLPPAPPLTDSILLEIELAKRRAEQNIGEPDVSPSHIDRMVSHLNKFANDSKSTKQGEENRRVVSAPIYSQYSTQWGKDKIPLPAISEWSLEDSRVPDVGKPRIVSAPTESSRARPTSMDPGNGLDFLSQQEKTIRLVTSPSSKINPVQAPAPLNIRKKPTRGMPALPPREQELNLRQQFIHDGKAASIAEERSIILEEVPAAPAKKKASWFKRSSKDKNAVFNSRSESTSSHTEQLTHTDTNSSAGPALPPAKKKSFNLAFWRNSKDQSQMQFSLADSDNEESPSPEPARTFSHPSRPPHDKRRKEAASTRNIEPQQNWLARLFRVKPATKYLCYSISGRRARQEIAIQLREWRKYGIRDVQADKERNIVFARVSKMNYLNLKEVSFAAEIMTVIEHGKRSPLCIVRFTQERGAASSFHKVVDTMDTVFRARNLLVVDKRKIKMMINTLNSS